MGLLDCFVSDHALSRILSKWKIREKFDDGKILCACGCKTVITRETLGMYVEFRKRRPDFISVDPSCGLMYHRRRG
jgi:hypothetical protein